jgi:peptidyl-prolyl cis-trans isomerase A (cyclophilin A)
MFTQITKKNTRKIFALLSIATVNLGLANTANATIVEIKTSLSDESIEVNLFDTTTPATVKNFLNYIDNKHYNNSVVHRVSPNFVVQAGGYQFTGDWPLTALVPNAPVVNEAIYSNVKGTIAMAKKGNDVNSATNQWFFNLADNSTNLDRQNGGFTVFGQVIKGFDIIEKIALLELCTNGGLQGIPMPMSSTQTCASLTVPGVENFVVIERVAVKVPSNSTDSDLNPLLSKYPDSDGDGVKDIDDAFPSDPNKTVPDADDSGGSMTWFAVAMLGLLAVRKRFLKA